MCEDSRLEAASQDHLSADPWFHQELMNEWRRYRDYELVAAAIVLTLLGAIAAFAASATQEQQSLRYALAGAAGWLAVVGMQVVAVGHSRAGMVRDRLVAKNMAFAEYNTYLKDAMDRRWWACWEDSRSLLWSMLTLPVVGAVTAAVALGRERDQWPGVGVAGAVGGAVGAVLFAWVIRCLRAGPQRRVTLGAVVAVLVGTAAVWPRGWPADAAASAVAALIWAVAMYLWDSGTARDNAAASEPAGKE